MEKLKTTEEVKAAILATLLNTKTNGILMSEDAKFWVSNYYDNDLCKRIRSVQFMNNLHIFTIRLDSKTAATKRGAQKIANLLLDFANVQDFDFIPNRYVINDLVWACKKEKAVNAIIYKNDAYNDDFPRMLEGVQYIIDGVYIRVEGGKSNYFLHVTYEGLDYKIDTTFAVMQSNHDYTIIDTANEKFYSTTNPLDTLLKLTGVR